VKVSDLVGALGKRAPFDLAESWDNVGLLAGDPAALVTGVVVSVNLGPEALEEAEKTGANTIACHHPPIFKPISKLTRTSHPYLYEAIRRGYSVIALHTNFDLSSEEASEEIATRLGFKCAGFLTGRSGNDVLPPSMRQGKFITYVPKEHLDGVREAVCAAGAGRIGEYSQCSFSVAGEGTFLGSDQSNPTIGKAGVLERASECRLEVLFPWKLLGAVVEAARGAHPYEEMAYDIYELTQSAKPFGYGFVAELESHNRRGSLDFPKFLSSVKHTFQLDSVTLVGPATTENASFKVRKMAFSPGSGSAFIGAAAAKGVDVYVCGEVGYHQMLEARQKGLQLVILGHSYSERFFVETVARWCNALLADASGKKVSKLKVSKIFEVVHVQS